MNRNSILLAMTLVSVMAVQHAGAAERPGERPFDVQQGARDIDWLPANPGVGQELRVQHPDGTLEIETFLPGMVPTWSVESADAQDGLYAWELTPVIAPAAETERLPDAVGRNRGHGVSASGYFSVRDGAMVPLDLEEAGPAKLPKRRMPAFTKQTISDDLTVYDSLCVGFDCLSAESYGADTIRLKEDNLRIHFDDTSSASGFPLNDWRIIANDSTSGGASYLAVEDSTAARKPFLVEAGARNSALHVDSSGRIGVGTGSPVVDLHVTTGNTPGLRMDQNTSGGFTGQIWDIAGNEANFFVRDVTGGSQLPFKIRPGAATNSLVVDADENIGLGLIDPTASLHVRRANGSASIFVDETSGTEATRQMLRLQNQGAVEIELANTVGTTWVLSTENDGFAVRKGATAASKMTVRDNGDIEAAGTLTEGSSRAIKDRIVAVNDSTLLAKLEALPISEWNYTGDGGDRHVGPMAEDFHAVFGLGPDDKHIAPKDLAGVALAAAKALKAENEQLKEASRAKDSRIQSLEARLERLEALVLDAR